MRFGSIKAVVLVVVFASVAVIQAAAARPFDWPAVQARLDEVAPAQTRKAHVPGAVVVVVKDGQVVLSRGYGFADLEARRPVDPLTTGFRAASVSKTITWTALMQLVEAGKVDLDGDVNGYLRSVQIAPRLSAKVKVRLDGRETGPGPKVRIAARPGDAVTVEDLMTHSAGFEDEGFGTIFLRDPKDRVPLAAFLGQHIPKRVRAPGEAIAYSNYSAALGALVVEEVSGEPFATYVERHIFAPLRMNATFEEPLPASVAAQAAYGYRWQNGRYSRASFESVGNWAPAGAMTASGGDMARWMNAMLAIDEPAPLLRPDTLATMLRPVRRMHPALPGVAHGLFEARIAGRDFLEHGGDIETFHTQVLLRPADRLGVYVAFNSPGGVAARGPIVEALVTAIYDGAVAQTPRPRITRTAAELAVWEGDYLTARRNQSTMAKAFRFLFGGPVRVEAGDGLLRVQEAGEVTAYEPVAPDVFQARAGADLLAFVHGEGGRLYMVRSGDPAEPLVRLAWHDRPGVTTVAVAVLLGGGAVLALYGAVALWPGPVAARGLRLVVLTQAFSLLGVFGCAWWAFQIDGVIALYTAVPAALRILGVLSVLSILSAIGVAALAVRGWRAGALGVGARGVAGLAVLTGALSAALFWNWNALGWWF